MAVRGSVESPPYYMKFRFVRTLCHVYTAVCQSVTAKLSALGIFLPPGPVRVDSYGDSPDLSGELLALIRTGRKRAGTGLSWAYEADGKAIPEKGDIEITVDDRNEPAFVTKMTRVEIIPYAAVNAEYPGHRG